MKTIIIALALMAGVAHASEVKEEGCMHAYTKATCVLSLPQTSVKPEVCDLVFEFDMSNKETKTVKTQLTVIPGKYSMSQVAVERTGEIIEQMRFSKSCK